MVNRVSIVGFGRFGKVLADLLKGEFSVSVHDPAIRDLCSKEGLDFVSEEEALKNEVIFYAVPINQFERVIKNHSVVFKSSKNGKLLIDVLSVKCFPRDVFKQYLPDHCQAMLTHPLFGPDSLREHGLPGLRIVLDRFTASNHNYDQWRDFFVSLGLEVIEMSAEEHDRLAANSQGVTFFLSRVLADFGLEYTPINTLWADRLTDIVKNISNDSWELFVDLQTKNPYTKKMRIGIGKSLDKIYNQLLPERIKPGCLILGIQGCKGSFNEEAARYYLNRANIQDVEIRYLYTTESVLKALHEGEIDRGQFAIQNSVGGIVDESVEAMAKYRFRIVEKFAIKISHALMTRTDVELSAINTIMTHPQVLKQCQKNLSEKYPHLKQSSGEGELVDHSKVAQLLAGGELPAGIAVMGSRVLAEIYNLKVVEDNLQDSPENYTSFLQVER